MLNITLRGPEKVPKLLKRPEDTLSEERRDDRVERRWRMET
jgi:hypothetical protein